MAQAVQGSTPSLYPLPSFRLAECLANIKGDVHESSSDPKRDADSRDLRYGGILSGDTFQRADGVRDGGVPGLHARRAELLLRLHRRVRRRAQLCELLRDVVRVRVQLLPLAWLIEVTHD